jgi:MFS family permease
MTHLNGFLVARFALGFGEAGVFPASLKAVAEWFPKKERALATGIFNAGTNLGAALTPFLVRWIFVRWGWRGCFFAIGAMGFAGLALWLWIYRRPDDEPKLTPGVAVEAKRYDGQVHAFFGLSALFDDGRAALDLAATALRRAFGTLPG